MTPIAVGLVGFDRVMALHLFGVADAFTAAALDDGYGGRIPCYSVTIVGLEAHLFRTDSGVQIATDRTAQSAPPFDTIIVVGGSGIRDDRVTEKLSEWLLSRAPRTRRIGAVGTGTYGLAATGLLDGRQVAAHWRIARDLAQHFPFLKVDHKTPLIHDGPFYTSSGLGAGLSVALAIIREDYGPYVAQSVESEFVLYPTAPDQEDLPERTTSDSHPADRFADLAAWIVRNLSCDLSVELLAKRACMCPTHFNKAFKSFFGETPMAFVENLRLNEVQRRLSKQQKTIQGIAASVGFADSAAFRRAYKRKFGARPISSLAVPPQVALGQELAVAPPPSS
jgi:transcriptional regulator GlxA family with amidase domain